MITTKSRAHLALSVRPTEFLSVLINAAIFLILNVFSYMRMLTQNKLITFFLITHPMF